MSRRSLARGVLLALLAIGILVAFRFRGALNVAALDASVRSAGSWGPAVYMAVYAAATVLFLPGAVITLSGGALFGPVWGTLYSLTGATAGALVAFLIARYVASDWVAHRTGRWTRELIDGVDREGWRFVAFVRLMPLFPFNLLNYALGLTRVGVVPYTIASYVFMLPGAVAYTYLGYAGREALSGAPQMIHDALLALGLLAAVAFAPRVIKYLRRETLSSAGLRQRLDRREDIAVLDVRSAKDYAGELGHIGGSINIPLQDLPQRLPELEPFRDRPLAVICRTNRMSTKAVELLRGAGFRKAMRVDDGMAGWRGQGFAAEEGGPQTAPEPPSGACAGVRETV